MKYFGSCPLIFRGEARRLSQGTLFRVRIVLKNPQKCSPFPPPPYSCLVSVFIHIFIGKYLKQSFFSETSSRHTLLEIELAFPLANNVTVQPNNFLMSCNNELHIPRDQQVTVF